MFVCAIERDFPGDLIPKKRASHVRLEDGL